MATFRLSDEVQLAEDERGSILLNVRDGRFYGVNEVGAAILAALRQGKEVAGIVSDLESVYCQPRATVETDVQAFISELARRGLGNVGE